jgi:hypothetical protein
MRNFIIILSVLILLISCKSIKPYGLSPATTSLIQTYRDLIKKTNNVQLCNENSDRKVYVTQSAMLSNFYYKKDTISGFLTFPSFYLSSGKDTLGSDKHHFYSTFSGNSHLGYGYYFGICPNTRTPVSFAEDQDGTNFIYKMPVIFPFPRDIRFTNEVFAVELIPVNDYKVGRIVGLAIEDIEEINEAYVESTNGYTFQSDRSNYNNMLSSKGVILNVKVKKRGIIKCYLINNAENAALIWKDLNYSE